MNRKKNFHGPINHRIAGESDGGFGGMVHKTRKKLGDALSVDGGEQTIKKKDTKESERITELEEKIKHLREKLEVLEKVQTEKERLEQENGCWKKMMIEDLKKKYPTNKKSNVFGAKI